MVFFTSNPRHKQEICSILSLTYEFNTQWGVRITHFAFSFLFKFGKLSEVEIKKKALICTKKNKFVKQNSASRPRTIVCRLRNWKERETILKCARRIKPDNIFVKEDLSPATLEKRESQRAKMEAAKRAGKIAYFVLDKLVIRDRPNVENS